MQIKINGYTLENAFINSQIQRVINTIDQFEFQYPIIGQYSSQLKKHAEVEFLKTDGDREEFFFYKGRIKSLTKTVTDKIPMYSVKCLFITEDLLNEFTYPNTYFKNQPLNQVYTYSPTINNVIPEGWTTTIEINSHTLNFVSSLKNYLKNILKIREKTGFNFRYIGTKTDPKQLEFGLFGESNGLTIGKLGSDFTIYEGSLSIEIQEDIINQLYPFGAGEGANKLTLRDVDISILHPSYPIMVADKTANEDYIYDPTVFENNHTSPNTTKMYYIQDTDSITEYGTRKIAKVFSDIKVNSDDNETFVDQDRITASNELYKESLQYLLKNKDQKENYKVFVTGKKTLQIGDTIKLKFKGEVVQNGIPNTIVDIDKELLIEGFTMRIKDGFKEYDLDLTTIIREKKDMVSTIGGIINEIEEKEKLRGGTLVTYPVYFNDSFDSFSGSQFFIWIPPNTQYTNMLNLKIRILPFRAYSKAVSGGGATTQTTSSGGATTQTTTADTSHSHTLYIPPHAHSIPRILVFTALEEFTYQSHHTYPGRNGLWIYNAEGNSGTSDPLTVLMDAKSDIANPPDIYTKEGTTSSTSLGTLQTTASTTSHSHSVTIPNHTHNVVLPDHTHSLQFGIYEDTTTPTDIRIIIDGHDMTPDIPAINNFGIYPTGTDTYNLLKLVENKGFLDSFLTSGLHEIEITCASGRARAELSIYNQFYTSN